MCAWTVSDVEVDFMLGYFGIVLDGFKDVTPVADFDVSSPWSHHRVECVSFVGG
jgi:hypothetical protein